MYHWSLIAPANAGVFVSLVTPINYESAPNAQASPNPKRLKAISGSSRGRQTRQFLGFFITSFIIT